MKTETIYIAEDGTRFKTKAECKQYEASKKVVVSTFEDVANLVIQTGDFSNVKLYSLFKFSEELIKNFEKENGKISDNYVNENGFKIYAEHVLEHIVESKLLEVVRNSYPHMANATDKQINILYYNYKVYSDVHDYGLRYVIDELEDLIELLGKFLSESK